MSDADETDDQRRARGLPPAPSLPGDERPPVNPPTPVTVSFALWLLSGAVLVAGFGLTLAAKQEIIDTLVEMNNDQQRISNEQIASGTTTLLWTLLVGAVAFAGLFALFAYKAREGTRSARTVLTVLAVTLMLFQMLFSNLMTLAAAFLALVATALLYLPTVQDYYPKVPRSL